LNISIINLLIISYNINIYIASALTIGIITCLRFLISKHFVYRISH
jgi:putative flippase GtrA